jgi:cytochrome c biogenesis protein CcmG/thiol:disulfide interchange protein DsbE
MATAVSTSAAAAPPDTSPAPPRRKRAPRRWWIVAAAATLAGALGGIGISQIVKASNTLHATSNQIFTSTGGVFDKGNGQPAPSWSLPSLRDPAATVSLSQFAGKPVVLNFWASWCPPCRKEMPALAATARRLQGSVAFVGIDTNDQRGAALSFASQTGVKYPLGFDPHASAANDYGVYGLPTTFFISAQGKLLGRQVGGMTAQRLDQLIQQTFSIHATTAGSR